MDKITTAELDASEIPEGFTAAGGGGNVSSRQDEQSLRDEAILDQALSSEALDRLKRIKLVKPEKAKKIESRFVSMVLQGKIRERMSEGKLIEFIERMDREAVTTSSSGAGMSKSGIQIQRKKTPFDSDSDNDSDGDLL